MQRSRAVHCWTNGSTRCSITYSATDHPQNSNPSEKKRRLNWPALHSRHGTEAAARSRQDGGTRSMGHVRRGSPDPAVRRLVRRGSPDPAVRRLVRRGSPDPAVRRLVRRGSPDPADSGDRRSIGQGYCAPSRDLRSAIPAGSGDPRRTDRKTKSRASECRRIASGTHPSSFGNRPVLSPSRSVGTPRRSSIDR
jgi:hypothetical protein